MDPKKLQELLNAIRERSHMTDNSPMGTPAEVSVAISPENDEINVPQQEAMPLNVQPGETRLPEADLEAKKKALMMLRGKQ